MSLKAFSVRLLDSLGLLRHFEYISGGDSVSERKPSPAPILDVLSHLAVKPADALFIGDSVYDVMAARAASVRVVAALYGFGTEDFSEGADFTLERIGLLVDIVKGLGS